MAGIGQGITRRSFANAVGGRMVKWKGGVASVAPNMMSVSVVALMSMGALSNHALAETIDDAQSSEVYVTIDEDVTITSTGSIDVVGSTPDETLLQVTPPSGPYTGTIQNDGALTAFLNDETSFTGIWVEGELAGVVNNAGTISLELSNSNSDVSAWGIYTDTVSGQITNSGLIDVAVHTVSYAATAYGIHVDGIAADASVTNTNAGTINVVATADLPSFFPVSASAYGIYVNGDVAGVLNNAGLISVQAIADTDSAIAYGIYVGGDVAVGGAVTNSGTITSYAKTTSDTTAYAYGIYVGGVVFGSIENSGLIAATALSVSYQAMAYGIYLDGGVAADGLITNTATGTINVQVTADSDTASAFGVYVDAAMAGTITNAGLIDVAAEAANDMKAYGIYAPYGVAGDIVNAATGTIQVMAISTGSSALAEGIFVFGALSGSIANAGLIAVTANGQNWASAYGIHIDNSGASGDIVNAATGTIQVTSNSTDSSGSAYGIRVEGNVSSTITNAGLIDVAVDGNDYASAYGMFLGVVGAAGTIDNTATGIIRVTANTTVGGGLAYGIVVNSTMSGTSTNAGLIDVAADVTVGGSAGGIYIGTVDATGVITNTGTILVVANSDNATPDAAAYGVRSNSFAGTLTNSGKISALDDGTIGDAIMLTGTGDVQLDTSGVLIGDIILNGGVTLNVQGAPGGSVYWTVANNTPAGNDFNLLGTDVPVFTRNINTTSAEFATFDASGIVGDHNANADASFMSLGTLADQTGKRAARPATNAPDNAAGLTPYVSIETISADYVGGDTTLGQTAQATAISFGETKLLGNGMALGFGGGILRGNSAVAAMYAPSSDTATDGGFVGVSLAGTAGGLAFGGSLTTGMLKHENSRTVNVNLDPDGFQTAVGNYDSQFVALQLDLATHVALGGDMALVPNAALRYANHKVDGYTETGADENATVAGQAFGVAEGEIGVSLERTVGVGLLSAGVSYVSRSVSGNNTTDVTLIGDTQAVSTAIDNTGGTKFSIGYSAFTANSMNIDFGAEALVGSNGVSGQQASLQIRFTF